MILLIARVPVKEGRMDDFLKEAARVAGPSREEEGCSSYEYFVSGEGENLVVFIEFWKDKEAITSHNGTKHFLTFQQAVDSLLSGAPEVSFYTGDPIQP
jgi:quinol monooxygenase YgiN